MQILTAGMFWLTYRCSKYLVLISFYKIFMLLFYHIWIEIAWIEIGLFVIC